MKPSLSEVIDTFNQTPQAQSIRETFPETKVVFTEEQYQEIAEDLLKTLRNLVKLNKGKKVIIKQLWADMVDITVEGFKAAERLRDLDGRADTY